MLDKSYVHVDRIGERGENKNYFGNFYIPGKILKQKGRVVSLKNHTVTPVSVNFSHLRLSYFTHTNISGNKKKKEKKQIISLNISGVVHRCSIEIKFGDGLTCR